MKKSALCGKTTIIPHSLAAVGASVLATLCAGGASAADYAWLSSPVNGNWFGAMNWNLGEWAADASNTATFGASSVTDVNVNGDVSASGVSVTSGAYAFTGGSITANGDFYVGEGATAEVSSRLYGTSKSPRFTKTGAGTLLVKGDAADPNKFLRFAVRGGTTVFDGGLHYITGGSDGAGETAVAGSFANSSRLEIKGGAKLSFTNNPTYVANSGCDIVISDGTFDCLNVVNEFLNGFADNNGTDQARTAKITIGEKGTMMARTLRIAQVKNNAAFWTSDYGVIDIRQGGLLKVRDLVVDGNYAPTATMNFDGGTLEFFNVSGDSANPHNRFGDETGKGWGNVTLNVLAGGLTINSNTDKNSTLYRSFRSGSANDGGLTIKGQSTVFLLGDNTYNGGTHLQGSVWLAIRKDGNLGAAPSEPRDSFFYESSAACLHFDKSATLDHNRGIFISSNVEMRVGAQANQTATIQGTVTGDGPGTCLKAVDNWIGVTALDPGAGRTNVFGRLNVCGRLNILSGTTVLTSESGATDANCGFYVSRDASTFDSNYSTLTVKGGRLVLTNSYAITTGGGRVIVTGGEIDATGAREWLNGLSGPGQTVVESAGALIAGQVRISQCNACYANTTEPLTSVEVNAGGVLRLNKFWIDTRDVMKQYIRGKLLLNGGTVVARSSRTDFLGDASSNWDNVSVRSLAGGARFDTAGFDIAILKAIVSGAAADGGLAKLGDGTLTLQGENSYNGPTRVEGGTLAFANKSCFPGGHLDFPMASLMARAAAVPCVTIPELVMKAGSKIRIRDADLLDVATFGTRRTLVSVTSRINALPDLALLDSNGKEMVNRSWRISLSSDGKSLMFGPDRGTVLVIR